MPTLALSAVMACALAAGCSSWDWRGPGFRDEPFLGRKPDPAQGKATGMAGLSTKSRQIERSLGVE
jgi:hypothetical protein